LILNFRWLLLFARIKKPDIIGLQETKVTDEDFPIEIVQDFGYSVEYHGQKTHYGVAIMSQRPFTNVIKGLPGDAEDAQRRLITATTTSESGKPFTVINGYFPNGEKRDHPTKFPDKQDFYKRLTEFLHSDFKNDEPLAVIGDYNVAPVDEDIGISAASVKTWLRTGHVSFLPEEREWFETLRQFGLDDTYRVKYPDSKEFLSWFDYRSRGFDREPKSGLRIDHLLTTKPLTDCLVDSGMDYDVRGMEKPSDHAPVWSEFDF